MPRDFQTSLSGGELSPSLRSHADLAKYRSGLALCRNWFVYAQGGISTRPGLEFVKRLDIDGPARLIPFQFNTEQTYAMVFSEDEVRYVTDGGIVLEDLKNIIDVTLANPVSIELTGHGFVTGDELFINDTVGSVQLNGRFATITVTDANNFTLDGIDGTGFDSYVSGGTVGRVYVLPTTYQAEDLFRLKYTQSADVMTVAHPDYQPREISRSDNNDWSIDVIDFGTGIQPPNAIGGVFAGPNEGAFTKNYSYAVTAVDANGSESVRTSILTLNGPTINVTRYANISWNASADAEYYNVYKENSDGSGILGFIGETEELEFKDYNFGPDMSVTPPLALNPFDGVGNYPGVVEYHQQRLAFAATNNQPQTIWMTKTADFDNMDRSRPTRDDDSLDRTIASKQVNEIRHMVSFDELILMTSGGIWKASGDQDGVITPSNCLIRTQGGAGVSHVLPLIVNDTAVYVQDKGSRVRDLQYTFESDKYSGSDLTIMARHFFEKHTIIDWCYAAEPYGIIWAVRDDGILLSLTYLKEQNVFAWAQHNTDGFFESCISISEGQEDAVYFIVRREINGETVRNVERMASRNFDLIEDAFCVDSGLTYRGRKFDITGATQANPVVLSVPGHDFVDGDVVRVYFAEPTSDEVEGMAILNQRTFTVDNAVADAFALLNEDGTSYGEYNGGGEVRFCVNRLSNLENLEGETVVALSDGNVVEDLVVENGAVDLPAFASIVHIGLPYICDMQSLEISFQQEVIQGRKKQLAKVWLRVLDSRGLECGANENQLFEFKERTPADGYGNIAKQDGQQQLLTAPRWTDYGQIYVRQKYPLPATIIALIPELVVSG